MQQMSKDFFLRQTSLAFFEASASATSTRADFPALGVENQDLQRFVDSVRKESDEEIMLSKRMYSNEVNLSLSYPRPIDTNVKDPTYIRSEPGDDWSVREAANRVKDNVVAYEDNNGIYFAIGALALNRSAGLAGAYKVVKSERIEIDYGMGRKDIVTAMRMDTGDILVNCMDTSRGVQIASVSFDVDLGILCGLVDLLGGKALFSKVDTNLVGCGLAVWSLYLGYSIISSSRRQNKPVKSLGNVKLGDGPKLFDSTDKCIDHDLKCSFPIKEGKYVFVTVPFCSTVRVDLKNCCENHDIDLWCERQSATDADSTLVKCIYSQIIKQCTHQWGWFCDIWGVANLLLCVARMSVLLRAALLLIPYPYPRWGGGAGWSCLCGGLEETYDCNVMPKRLMCAKRQPPPPPSPPGPTKCFDCYWAQFPGEKGGCRLYDSSYCPCCGPTGRAPNPCPPYVPHNPPGPDDCR
jgi:hypothetical protein